MVEAFKAVLFGALVVGAAACGGRQHMSEDYGTRNRAWFDQQHVYSTAAEDVPQGLDSEEAALIQAQYRRAIGGETASAQESKKSSARVLLLQDDSTPKKND